jgi:PBP1b-binding outer membrane lipoprotein LpoB
MTHIATKLAALLVLALALSGCVAYPAGYYGGYGYGPAVAVAVPCCAYGGGYGYRRW